MEFLLLLGLAVLWAMHHRLSLRVKALEEELGVEPVDIVAPAPARKPPATVTSRAVAAESEPAPFEEAPPALDDELGQQDAAWPEAPAEARPESLGGLFERYVGGRLLVWVGGIALAVAGVLLVRYSIEIGLITPPVRMGLAALFGLLLVGAGEFARSRPDGLVDRRFAQSLVGAGILVLYATPYGSHILYQLIDAGTAFLLMAAVTVAALLLALRHGAPAAVLGLLGGFATPILVGEPTETLVPLLTYLGLLDLALFVLAGRRGWTWLAAGAVLLSFAWTGAFLLGSHDDALAAGLFLLGLSLAASLIRAGGGWHLDFIRPAAIGLLQLTILVARTDLGLPAWALFGTLSLASLFLAMRKPEYRWLPALALALALALLAGKGAVHDTLAPPVAVGIAALFGLGLVPAAWRGPGRRLAAVAAAAAFVGPALIMRLAWPDLLGRPLWAAIFLAAALGPLGLAWLRRGDVSDGEADVGLFFAAWAAAILAGVAAYDLLPLELVGSAWLVLAAAAAFAARRTGDSGLSLIALLGLGVAGLWSVAMVPRLWETVALSLVGEPALAPALPTLVRAIQVLVVPLPFLVLLHRLLPRHYPQARPAPALVVAGLLAAAAGYVLFKQAFGLADPSDFVARGFLERAILTQALFLAGWALCSERTRLPRIPLRLRRQAGLFLTAFAAARLVWFDLLIHNPALAEQWVGSWPVINLLLAYPLAAFWLYRARRAAGEAGRSGLWLALFLAALIAGVGLIVRQMFHGAILVGGGIPDAESYAYSVAGLVLSMALLWAGVRLPDKAVRIAGLGLLSATTFKVFASDASVLEGLLRILSFIPLGVALIVIGKLYANLLRSESPPPKEPADG